MKEYSNILQWLDEQNKSDKSKNNTINKHSDENKNIIDDKPRFFSIDEFISNLKKNSEKSKFERLLFSDNINAYDISQCCIAQVLYRLYNTPVPSYEDVWLPVYMRAVIGNAVHEFIQSNFNFDEIEVVVKIDKFKFSGRIDAIINNNVLVEIKTVSYNDYKSIINTNMPRDKDLHQTLIYKYLLENYLDEINKTRERLIKEDSINKTKYNWPRQNNYSIKYIQYIYVAHDLTSSEVSSISEALYIQKQIKKQLNSKYNKFFFIKDIIIDIEQNKEYYQQLEQKLFQKLQKILFYYNRNKLPNPNDEYIDKNQCFFCLYKDICNYT